MWNKEKIDALIKLGEEFGCEFFLPPGKDVIQNPFFDISGIRNNEASYRQFLYCLKEVDSITFDVHEENDRLFLEIKNV